MGHVNADAFQSISSANRLGRSVSLFLGLAAVALLVGCSSPSGSSNSSLPGKSKATTSEEVAGRLRTGDQIQIRLTTGQQQNSAPESFDVSVDENGEIHLPLVGGIKAAGLTQSELAESIEANYVPRYYVRCTATVLTAQRYFYISGEVRNPGRFLWSDDTTLLKAISTASGFTDYANRGKVQLVRGNQRLIYNYNDLQRNPGKDPLIRPGDTITVERSIF
jgi:protein involved in polysaccharide export with SLBB domain